MAMGSFNSGGSQMPTAEINMTPLVDVMLVLLIVFMVAAPLMATGMPVDLPKAAARPIDRKRTPLVVSVDRDGKVYVDRDPVEPEALAAALERRMQDRGKDEAILVKGDQGVPYGRVMEVVAVIGQAGIAKVSLLAEPPKGKKP